MYQHPPDANRQPMQPYYPPPDYWQIPQGKLTEPAFVQFWQALGGVKGWSTTSLQEQGSTATAALTLTLGNGQTRPASIALIDENGAWKIENETIA